MTLILNGSAAVPTEAFLSRLNPSPLDLHTAFQRTVAFILYTCDNLIAGGVESALLSIIRERWRDIKIDMEERGASPPQAMLLFMLIPALNDAEAVRLWKLRLTRSRGDVPASLI